MLHALDASAVRRWYEWGLAALDASRDEINALNVFPVPDADTGTNLHVTLESASRPDGVGLAPPALADDLAVTASEMARLSLLGARGSSGVILSQLLRGVAEVLAAQRRPPRGRALARALERAATLAYAAVSQPVEGTMLSVARAAAEAARATGSDDLPTVAEAAARAAREALDATPAQLDVLGQAGVVDAGGAGVVVLLDVLRAVVEEQPMLPAPALDYARPRVDAASCQAAVDRAVDATPAFEVMYLLDAPADRVAALRASLDRVGDSVVVSGGDGLWHVHVHTDDASAAVDAGAAAGRPHRVKVTPLLGEIRHGDGEAGPDSHAVVVVLTTGSPAWGLRAAFNGDGAHLRAAAPTLADEIAGLGADRVALLADADSAAAAAAAADALGAEGKETALVAARSVVQLVAAVAVHDPHRPLGADVVAMRAAADATRHGTVRVEGDRAVGEADGIEPVAGGDPCEVAATLLDRMLAGALAEEAELVTIAASPQACEAVGERVLAHHPGVEVVAVPADLGAQIWLGVE